MRSKISPSMMCADWMNLGSDIKIMEECGIEYLHVDIMDGSFVQNYTLGTDYIKALHKATKIPLDIHLMIDKPECKLDWFEFKPGDYVAVHYEATAHVQRVLQKIKDMGAKAMIALNPATPICVLEDVTDDIDGILLMTVNPGFAGQKLIPQTLNKIKRLRNILDENGYDNIDIEVDGNVSFENAVKMREAGANIFVGGSSSVFHKDGKMKDNIDRMRRCI